MRNHLAERLSTVAHYVIARTPPDQLGATKLNKVLWWVDCAAYARWGRSITGLDTYLRMPHGPVPDGISDALAILKLNGSVGERSCGTPVGPRREFVALKEPPLESFSAEEIDLISQIVLAVTRMSAQEASELSHDALWEEAGHLGSMPVAAGAISTREVRSGDLEWAERELAALSL